MRTSTFYHLPPAVTGLSCGLIGDKCHFQNLRSYRGQFYWQRKLKNPDATADLRQVTDILPNMQTCMQWLEACYY